MTERLYYTDAYRTEFEGNIVEETVWEGQPVLILDRSCFYPTSGGQPFDTGWLGSARVVDVVADADERILHCLDREFEGELSGVHGQIDWLRRYDHMQQHSGQHLLSQIFYQRFGYETVSVHFGAEDSTIDFEVAEIEAAQLDEAERVANDLVYENRPITAWFVSETELNTIPLRRPPKVARNIRIVEIEDFDYSACGGTHCRSTAELGPIKLLRQERRRGNVRVAYKCGRRAYTDYAQKHRLITESAALFSTDIGQVPTLIERDLAQIKELQRAVAKLTAESTTHEVGEYLGQAIQTGRYQVVSHVFADREASELKQLANRLQEHNGVIALLASVAAEKATVIFARASDVDVEMGRLLRETLGRFGGGGGGRPEFAQGGGVAPDVADDLLAAALHTIQTEQQE